tara:strand:+ start:490 stop:1014 length:525 start_codon:yes stop_codon:yes gene_type:complete
LRLFYALLPYPCQKKIKEYLVLCADIIINDYEREVELTKLGEYFSEWSDGLDDSNQETAELSMCYYPIYNQNRELYLWFTITEKYIGYNISDLYIRGTHIEYNKYYFKINLKDAGFYSRDLFIHINKEDLGDAENFVQIYDKYEYLDFNSWIEDMEEDVQESLKTTFESIVNQD